MSSPRTSPGPDAPQSYTAAEIATALSLSKRAVLKCLANTQPTDSKLVHGNAAQTWALASFPPGIVEHFARLAANAGVTDWRAFAAGCFKLLAQSITPWQPPLALSEVSADCLALVTKLRAALMPALQRMGSPVLTPADETRLGLADYQRAFGHEITERHWRRLMDRTLKRDGGVENFERLEIYLPEKPVRKDSAARLLPDESGFAHLREMIQSCADASAPTNDERAAIWAEAFELYEASAGTRRERRSLQRQLVQFLFRHVPALARNAHALRVSFERKLERWKEQGESAGALLDGRALKSGVPSAKPIPQDDVDRLTWHAAANCGGRVAQAVREYAQRGNRSELSKETVELITRPHARKSHINRRLASKLGTEVKAIAPFFLGKRAKDDATAHIERDYSKLAPMEVISADDFTFPVYFYVPDGNGWFTLTRGQCLLMLDVRSWKVIAWSLQPERNYNSLVIRTLMNRVCSAWGIPGTWYFERGIWKNSHVVKGTVPAGWQEACSWLEAKTGWENLGVQFRHAIRARTKPVERVGGLLQDLMHGVRGYCGRDERRDCPEVTTRAMQDVQFRRVNHPGELFLSFDEWHAQLGQIIDNYNAASQDGKVLQGFSPEEFFEQNWPHSNPPSRLDANTWHLVAHYVSPRLVTTNGISFRIGSKSYIYRNERTGQDRGKTVLAWFDPECPQQLGVTDMNRKNPYLVERSTPVDFLAQPGDATFDREMAKAASHSKYPRARFTVLQARFAPTFRRNVVDADTAATGQSMLAQRETKAAEQKQASAQHAKARSNYGKLGMAVPNRVRPEQIKAARELAELLDDDTNRTGAKEASTS